MYSSEDLNAACALELRIRIPSQEIFVFVLRCCLIFFREGRHFVEASTPIQGRWSWTSSVLLYKFWKWPPPFHILYCSWVAIILSLYDMKPTQVEYRCSINWRRQKVVRGVQNCNYLRIVNFNVERTTVSIGGEETQTWAQIKTVMNNNNKKKV